MYKYDREKALELLQKYTQSESLLRHAYAVEQAMRKYAKFYGENEDKWGITGLLHDFDYERYPSADEHPYRGNKILKDEGYEDDILEAIMGHAEYTGVPRKSLMAKTLFACDELVGFIFAVTYVRPSKAVHDVKVKSVTKKLKTLKFAASVNRDDINNGIVELGVDRTEHIQFVIDALKEIAEDIGLAG